MIYTMFTINPKQADEDIQSILRQYIAKHGKPPEIIETHPTVEVHLEDVPVLSFTHVQPGLVYLGEEQTNDEPNPS